MGLPEYKEIPLTRGRVALVDAEDYAVVAAQKWFAERAYGGKIWYAACGARVKAGRSGQRLKRLHQVILGERAGFQIDHVNGNGLDNRRSNLRWATVSEQMANRRFTKPHSSRFRGVWWDKATKRWAGQIGHNKKNIHLGKFSEEEDAARAYDAMARKLFGEFAVVNFNN